MESEPKIPPRTSSKRAFDEYEPLEQQQRNIEDSLQVAQKKLEAQGSFNAQFWTQAAEVEDIILQRHQIESKISLRDFEGTEAE